MEKLDKISESIDSAESLAIKDINDFFDKKYKEINILNKNNFHSIFLDQENLEDFGEDNQIVSIEEILEKKEKIRDVLGKMHQYTLTYFKQNQKIIQMGDLLEKSLPWDLKLFGEKQIDMLNHPYGFQKIGYIWYYVNGIRRGLHDIEIDYEKNKNINKKLKNLENNKILGEND